MLLTEAIKFLFGALHFPFEFRVLVIKKFAGLIGQLESRLEIPLDETARVCIGQELRECRVRRGKLDLHQPGVLDGLHLQIVRIVAQKICSRGKHLLRFWGPAAFAAINQ